MRPRTKYLIKNLAVKALWLMFGGFVIWANIVKLRNNDYSNYEKVIDYGRIKDEDKLIRPAIAAIFYQGKSDKKYSLSTYFNHSANYKKQNVRMVVVPKNLASYNAEVVEKLYEELRNNNKIEKVLLVYDKDSKSDVKAHKKMLLQIMDVQSVDESPISQNNLKEEKSIDAYLSEAKRLVVFLADLDKGLNDENSDFLVGEAVYFAQKYFYQMNVFDIIDTQLAKALDKDYGTLYPLETMKDEPLLTKQKRNLERYKRHYWHVLSNYFELNMLQVMHHKQIIMPSHIDENYRLFDRGRLVLKAFDDNYVEIFEKAEMQENKGIAFLLAHATQKLVDSGKAKNAKYFKIYLLTDLEKVKPAADTMLMSYLEQDDGIFAEYKDKSALLVADDRPDNPEDLSLVVRQKANIPDDVSDVKIDYYRFKTVEMNYGD